jgi:hypothetical protein
VWLGDGRDRVDLRADGERDQIRCGQGHDVVAYSGLVDQVDSYRGCEEVIATP